MKTIDIAKEAGFEFDSLGGTYTSGSLLENLERFEAIIRTNERDIIMRNLHRVFCNLHENAKHDHNYYKVASNLIHAAFDDF